MPSLTPDPFIYISDVLKQVRHPHIISMQGMYEDNEAVYIVTDHAKGGEFFDRLLRKGSYTEKDASNLLRQILEALAYLHEHDVSLLFLDPFINRLICTLLL